MNKKVKKGIDIGAIVLACVLFLMGAAILTLTLTKNKTDVPSIFGVTFLDIRTDSMQGTVNPGDVAVIGKVKSIDKLKKGDIITFWDIMDFGDGPVRALNTHRITRIEDGPVEKMIYTQGDKEGLDEDLTPKKFGDVVGKYSFRVPVAGFVIRFLQTPVAFGLIVILPLVAFLAYRIVILAQVVLQLKKEKAKAEGNDPEDLKAELDALRAKIAAMDGLSPSETTTDLPQTDSKG